VSAFLRITVSISAGK